MTPSLLTANLFAHALQTALLLGIGSVLVARSKLSRPAVCLRYWQILLAVALMLPLVRLAWPSVPVSADAAGFWTDVWAGSEVSADALVTKAAASTPWHTALLIVVVLGVAARLGWLGLTLGYVCILAYLHFSSQKDKP